MKVCFSHLFFKKFNQFEGIMRAKFNLLLIFLMQLYISDQHFRQILVNISLLCESCTRSNIVV